MSKQDAIVFTWFLVASLRREDNQLHFRKQAYEIRRTGLAHHTVLSYLARRGSLAHFLRCCSNTNTPFLFDTITSGSLSPLMSSTTNWVPMPESLSISCGVKLMMPSALFLASNQ